MWIRLAMQLPVHAATLSGLVMEKGEPAGRAEVKLVDADKAVSKVR